MSSTSGGLGGAPGDLVEAADARRARGRGGGRAGRPRRRCRRGGYVGRCCCGGGAAGRPGPNTGRRPRGFLFVASYSDSGRWRCPDRGGSRPLGGPRPPGRLLESGGVRVGPRGRRLGRGPRRRRGPRPVRRIPLPPVGRPRERSRRASARTGVPPRSLLVRVLHHIAHRLCQDGDLPADQEAGGGQHGRHAAQAHDRQDQEAVRGRQGPHQQGDGQAVRDDQDQPSCRVPPLAGFHPHFFGLVLLARQRGQRGRPGERGLLLDSLARGADLACAEKIRSRHGLALSFRGWPPAHRLGGRRGIPGAPRGARGHPVPPLGADLAAQGPGGRGERDPADHHQAPAPDAGLVLSQRPCRPYPVLLLERLAGLRAADLPQEAGRRQGGPGDRAAGGEVRRGKEEDKQGRGSRGGGSDLGVRRGAGGRRGSGGGDGGGSGGRDRGRGGRHGGGGGGGVHRQEVQKEEARARAGIRHGDDAEGNDPSGCRGDRERLRRDLMKCARDL
mmetsp:Transcript_6774/g.23343  ORF Transcript_6774/g.23343 Transcript_6774/m.23343 type:complete len:501 (-) Transcript_6774:72-1574(-)